MEQLDILTVTRVYLALMRYIAPIFAGILLLRCAWPLLTFRREPEIWDGWSMPMGNVCR